MTRNDIVVNGNIKLDYISDDEKYQNKIHFYFLGILNDFEIRIGGKIHE